ncbi:hypothetical protein BJI67_08705 [Acidihalobacter aeolianus]|uniref:Diguanylate cyclase DosC n=1 Tax=Acidihalobacter aeolianus TaxID=2792603 RepID=A0A1D8K836_9GAMM|nr:EAL domain-containing protein [Acidihalobacter aeolianus]AOV17127.1 hypothetical protein BJI67_08705 [Acidihalobacter aeolianus]
MNFDLARFLGIGEADVSSVLKHADALTENADELSSGFYDYLHAHPETQRLFADYGSERMRELAQMLADNFRTMLGRHDGDERRRTQGNLGSRHYQAGVMTTWIVGAYRLYIDFLHERLAVLDLDVDARRRLEKALIKYVLYDMSLQLDGYEQARRTDLAERDKVAQAALAVTMSLDKASALEDVLTSMCDRVVSASAHLRAAWFCLGEGGASELTPSYFAGDISCLPQRIDVAAAGPLGDALRELRPVVVAPKEPGAPEWSQQQAEVQTIGIFPFALRNTAVSGCFVAHADRPRYFDDAGLSIFESLAMLAQLLIELREQIQRDALTGLPNRSAFSVHLAAALERAERAGGLLCVGILDLDDFKPVNDHYGHHAGDDLLRMLAERLRRSLRSGDMIARLSGDEFALVLDSVSSLGEAEAVFSRIGAALSRPFTLADGTLQVLAASLGVTVYPFDETDVDGLIRHADQAMYEAKNRKDERTSFWNYWSSPHQDRSGAQSAWAGSARAVAYFQPVADLNTRRVIAVEALARLELGNGRVLSPAEFLRGMGPVARRDLSREMLRQGLDLLRKLDEDGMHLNLSFNVDADFILDIGCVDCFNEVLRDTGIEPARITLEILESGEFLATEAALELMASLRATGARIALDDVGSAYSSLLRLKELPIDRIKLDQAFVRDLAQYPSNLVFVMSLQSLALGFGVQLIVEGVETHPMLDAMAALGVDAVQGYALTPPLNADALTEWLVAYPGGARLPGSKPSTLLGAYGAHLRQRALMEQILREGSFAASLNRAQRCPLVQFLQNTGVPPEHPLLRIHDEIMVVFGGHGILGETMSDKSSLMAAEEKLAKLVSQAMLEECTQTN